MFWTLLSVECPQPFTWSQKSSVQLHIDWQSRPYVGKRQAFSQFSPVYPFSQATYRCLIVFKLYMYFVINLKTNDRVKHFNYTYVHTPSSLYSACIHDNKQFLRFFFRGKIYTSECVFVHTYAIFLKNIQCKRKQINYVPFTDILKISVC